MNKKIIFFILICISILLSFMFFKSSDKTKYVSEESSEEGSLEKSFKNEKYYIEKNLNRYLKYYEQNSNLTFDKVISNVNTNVDKIKYEDVREADLNKGVLILVNKYYYLPDGYNPSDLVTLNGKYNSGVNSKMRNETADAFMKMSDAATLDNVTITNASAFRSYEYQVNLYDKYVEKDGKKAADTYSARPGFSEHQTGLCTDINQIDSGFETTDAFKWLDKNAYKYGFIIRFPKDKEDITGYQYEPWHWRYVGKMAAKIIKKENITFEEYYAYYVEK